MRKRPFLVIVEPKNAEKGPESINFDNIPQYMTGLDMKYFDFKFDQDLSGKKVKIGKKRKGLVLDRKFTSILKLFFLTFLDNIGNYALAYFDYFDNLDLKNVENDEFKYHIVTNEVYRESLAEYQHEVVDRVERLA